MKSHIEIVKGKGRGRHLVAAGHEDARADERREHKHPNDACIGSEVLAVAPLVVGHVGPVGQVPVCDDPAALQGEGVKIE